MAKTYDIKGSVADGDYFTDSMSTLSSEFELSFIHFYNSSGVQVTPTAGTVIVTGSPDGTNWREIPNGTFAASDAYSLTRDAPYGQGLMVKARLQLTGIVGADNFVANVWRD